MAKKTYFFRHDMNAHQDPKVKAMMFVYGAEGYGWWWIILEIMAQEENGRISIVKKYDIPSLASSLPNCSADKCREFIDDCINEFELFNSDGERISSDRLDRDLDIAFKKSNNGKKAANARWAKNKKKETPTDVFSDDKEKPKTPEDLSKIKDKRCLIDDELFKTFYQQLKQHKDFQNMLWSHAESERDKCLDWLSANGKVKKDYKAFFRSWLRNNFGTSNQSTTESVIPRKKGQKPMVL